MKLLRHFIILVLCLTVLTASLLGTGYFLLTTQRGAMLLVPAAMEFLPGKVRVQTIEGRLASHLLLKNVTFSNQTMDIYINELRISWNLADLLTKKHVQEIVINHLRLQYHARTNTSHTAASMSLPSSIKSLSVDKFSIEHLELLDDTHPPLNGKLFLTYLKGIIPIIDLALTHGKTQFNITGSIDDNWHLTWKISLPDIQTIIANYQGDFSSHGTITGPLATPLLLADIEVEKLQSKKLSINSLKAKLKTHLAQERYLRFIMDAKANKINIEKYSVAKPALQATLDVQKQRLLINMKGTAQHLKQLTGQIILPHNSKMPDMTTPLTGKFLISIDNIQRLPLKIPDVTILKGDLTTSITINGTLNNPAVNTRSLIKNAGLAIPSLGINVSRINLEGHSDNIKTLEFNGQFMAGNGQGKTNGKININNEQYDATIQLKGDNLLAANLKTYKINISPNVTVHYTNNNLYINGDINIPYASITPDYFNDLTTLPPDVVFVNNNIKETPFLNKLSADINLTLTNAIKINYNELNTSLTGSLTLNKNYNGPITASGALHTIDGTYAVYGKTLAIQEGRLTYAGNLLFNPGLTIKATKKINVVSTGGSSPLIDASNAQPTYTGSSTMTVGISVYGTFEHPVISFFSDQTGLSQKDILSYLLFGYPSINITSVGSMMVLNNAFLNAKQGTKMTDLTSNIEQRLQLNELGVKSLQYFNPETHTTENTTAFTVGKSFGDRLSINYSMGLLQSSISVLTARFKLTNSLAIQAETNALENGVDLLYEIE